MREKLTKVRARGYITDCKVVKSYTNHFPVPKTWREATTEERKRRVYNKRRRKLKGRQVEQIGGEVEGMKMAEDIRTVCDATSLELNDSIWAPWSPMPTVESYLRAVESETFMPDCDVGKMFLKLM